MIIGKILCYTEVITAVSTKSTVFWVVTKCSTIEVYWRFGGQHWFHFQGQRIRKANNQQKDLVSNIFGFQFILTSENVGKHPGKTKRCHIPEDNNQHKYLFRRMGMILTASWEIHWVRDGVVAVYTESYEHVSGRIRHRGL
jgi:hypothetical protein